MLMDREERPLRCVMLGMEGPGFIADWALAASSFADVVGVGVVRRLPEGEPLERNAVIAWDPPNPFPIVLVRAARLRPARVWWRLNARVEARALSKAVRAIERRLGKVDLIHSHFYSAASAMPYLAKRLEVPYVHTEHSSDLADLDEVMRVSRPGRKILRSVLQAAAAVLFVGERSLQNVRKAGLDGKFHVMPNPVDEALFAPQAKPHMDKRLKLVTVTRLIDHKRVDLLLHTVAHLHRQGREFALEVVGDGPCRDDLETLARDLGISAKVSFLGRLKHVEVASHLGAADIYVHTSSRESFGIAIVEALFVGLPVVAAAAGGVTDTLPEGCGTVVEDATPEALASSILDVAHRLASFDRVDVSERARSIYGRDSIISRLESVYLEATRTT